MTNELLLERTQICKRVIKAKNLSKRLYGSSLAWNDSKRSNNVIFSAAAENDKSQQRDT